MEVTAPVTDYIRRSLLTNRGDLVKHDGESVKRFPVGTDGHILRVQSPFHKLEYEDPGNFLFQQELTDYNPFLITITTAPTNILRLNIGNVILGERYFIACHVYFQKDAVEAGQVRITLRKNSGAGDFVMFANLTELFAYHNLLANQYANFHGAIILQITTTGDLEIELNGLCDIGTAVVDIANAQLYSSIFKKIYVP